MPIWTWALLGTLAVLGLVALAGNDAAAVETFARDARASTTGEVTTNVPGARPGS